MRSVRLQQVVEVTYSVGPDVVLGKHYPAIVRSEFRSLLSASINRGRMPENTAPPRGTPKCTSRTYGTYRGISSNVLEKWGGERLTPKVEQQITWNSCHERKISRKFPGFRIEYFSIFFITGIKRNFVKQVSR